MTHQLIPCTGHILSAEAYLPPAIWTVAAHHSSTTQRPSHTVGVLIAIDSIRIPAPLPAVRG